MSTLLERHRSDLERLRKIANDMVGDLTYRATLRAPTLAKHLPPEDVKAARSLHGSFEKHYQRWYTESHATLKQVLPDRLVEFDAMYLPDPRRKAIDVRTYTIQDFLNGLRAADDVRTGQPLFDDLAATVNRLSQQREILASAEARFESSLLDIRQLVQADLFDSELSAATQLAKHGFLRAAGTIAGVVLEKHLNLVCSTHGVAVKRTHPTIGDLNDLLKDASVLDVPQWRSIQRLADLRNIAAHDRRREPTADEIRELIEGVDRACKTLY